MKKSRLLSLLLTLLLLASVFALPVGAAEAAPEDAAATESAAPWEVDPTGYRENLLADVPPYEALCETALLLEMNSGIVIYEKNTETKVYPASLTKIMTCMLTLEYAGNDLDKVLTVSQEALEGIEEAGGEIKLQVGERLTLRDLLYYLMVTSTNEAGNVIAEYVAGDVSSFVKLMNNTAAELGCTSTHFTNTHGLHDNNHYTTARDLSIITRKALTYEIFREICNTEEYTVPATNLSKSRKLITTNYLLQNDGKNYMGDDGLYHSYYLGSASGIKTGYTSAAGRCVISRASNGNMDLLCVIMGAQTRMMPDDSVRYDNFVEAKKLFDYGFSNFSFAKVAAAGIEPMFQVNVEYAMDRRGVVLIPSSDVSCLLPKEYEKDRVTTRCELYDSKGLVAPLEQGQKVGKLYVSYDGTVIGTAELETLTAVEEKSVDKAIADFTGKDKSEEEKSVLQKLLGYWYVPFLVILGLFLVLILRNAIYRHRRRVALERRRKRSAIRDAKAAEAQRAANPRRNLADEPTRRVPTPRRVQQDRDPRGGRP